VVQNFTRRLQMNDDGTFTLTLDSNYTSDGTVTIDTSSWDDSFTTSPTSIYSSPASIYSSNGAGNGNVEIEGELTVGGVDVVQSIKDMQRVLGVVSRDLDKEEKYAGLKRAAEAYERELAKIETFETLKDSA
jgi:hypothetical protein